MTQVEHFEDMPVWQEARILNREIHGLLKGCHDYGFIDQISRASVSVMNNIAEGFERSNTKEFRHFLRIAKGSVGEVRSMLYLASDFEYIPNDQCMLQTQRCVEISRMLAGFMRYLHARVL